MYNDEHDLKAVVAEDYTEPVTLDEVKAACHLTEDQTSDDEYIEDIIIPAARETVEQWTKISCVEKTVTAVISNPRGNYELPCGPVTGDVVLTDENDDTYTDPTIRGIDFKILVTPRKCWLTAVYPAGYTPDTIPKGLKQAIIAVAVDMYEHRGDEVITDQNFFSARGFALAKTYSRIPLIQ